MTPQELKASILQLAIQGKLVEQRAEEGTGDGLYQQIQVEKQKLIKAGKIKKEKPLLEISEDEKPFEIPESWKWARLRDICTKIVDGDHNPPLGVNRKTKYWMLSAQNINYDDVVELDQMHYLEKDVFEKVNERTKVQIGDVFLTIVGTLGRSCVYKGGRNICFQRSVSVITTLAFNYYLKCVFDSGYIQQFMVENATGTAQKGFYLKQLENMVIPIPPLAEQKRIVAKIEELLPYIDRYEKAWNRLEDFSRRFPADLQKSILQLAIQGKLVEQRPEEGTGEELYRQIQAEKQKLIKAGKIKKEKPLPEIAEDEIPFDIPESWTWVRLRGLCQTDISYGIIKLGAEDPKGVRVLRCSDVKENYIVPDFVRTVEETLSQQFSRTVLQGGEIVINVRGTLGGCAVVPHEMCGYNVAREVAVIRQCDSVNAQYIVFLLLSGYFQKYMFHGLRGIAYKGLNMGTLALLPVPLPPLAEQKRIVARLEEILPLCERLK